MSFESRETFVLPIESRGASIQTMLNAEEFTVREILFGAIGAGELPGGAARVMSRRAIPRARAEHPPQARERSTLTARDGVRVAAIIAIVIAVWLSVVDVWELEFPDGGPGDLRFGILIVAITIPLHIRHLIYGVRGERPPAGAWTLALMAIATFAGVYLAGFPFGREFAPLAVSTLIVVRGRWGVLLACVVMVAPPFLIGMNWYADATHALPGIYFSFVVFWRAGTQFIPLRLLAVLRALDSAAQELEVRAVVLARVRIDSELREGIGSALREIVAHGETARAEVERHPARAIAELRRLSNESRRALADARRVVAGYRTASVRAELDAASALLEASGARVRIVVPAEARASLDRTDSHARSIIRAAFADALRGEGPRAYIVHAARDAAGELSVRIAADDPMSEFA